jgi:type I restriction-modification system DNA methylase subunit
MDQPSLPGITPYTNRYLFSDHYLKTVLPGHEAWEVAHDGLKLAIQALRNLYAGREEEWSKSNEAQLENKLIRPALQALGHRFEVQPPLPTPETVSRPDYAFFQTDEEREHAKKEHDGEIEYFDRVIAVGDAKRWDRPLDKGERGSRDRFDRLSPSWQIDYYLRMSGVKWGILTNGRLWRLYSQDTSFRLDINYEIDLPRLLAARDLEAFKYFFLFFRRQAFVADAEGLRFLDGVYQGSLEYAQAVGDDLKENVYKALRLLAEGFLHTRDNRLDPDRDLEEIHANSLVFLYRLLFINYAEDRGLLPRDNALYRDSYSLVAMEREIASKAQRRESIAPLQATYWGKLKTLFDLINQGSAALGIDPETMEVPPYNGGLFDPQKHPFVEKHKVEDRWLAHVIDLLGRSQAEGVGRGFVDYSNLDVRHLGSIYEGLLEYKLRVADEEMAAVKRRGREQWIPAGEVGSTRVLERVEPGSVYLATDRGERKATGSYYTPDYIVKYIVEHTVGPLIEERMQEGDPIEGILSLKVLDPAMGSGHFLVEATDRLAHALVEALGGAEQEPEEEDIRWARREVVERCIYGVDLNPLAVELAKLGLWLHTVAEGKPLNFLDHHLKVGNSLIGAWVEDLGTLPARTNKGKAKNADVQARQKNLFEIQFDQRLPEMLNKVLEIIRRRSDTLDDIKAKLDADRAVEELRAPFKAVADLWTSMYFGNELSRTEYQEALEHIGDPGLLTLPWVQLAQQIAHEKQFFHWELEFPEAFYDQCGQGLGGSAGFDAVAGNPPYLFLSGRDSPVKRLRDAGLDEMACALEGEIAYLSSAFAETSRGCKDYYKWFIQRASQLTRRRARLSYVVSNTWVSLPKFQDIRRLLARSCRLVELVDLGFGVFEDPTVPACIYVSESHDGPTEQFGYCDLKRVSKDSLTYDQFCELLLLLVTTGEVVTIDSKVEFGLYRSLVSKRLLRDARRGGVLTRWSQVLVLREGEHSLTVGPDLVSKRQLDPTDVPVILDWTLARYVSPISGYTARENAPRFDRSAHQGSRFFLRKTGDSLIAAAAPSEQLAVAHQNVYVGRPKHPRMDVRYLVALLGSRLIDHVYKASPFGQEGRIHAQLRIDFIYRLPFPTTTFSTPQANRARLAAQGSTLAEDWISCHGAGTGLAEFLDSSLGGWIEESLAGGLDKSDVLHDVVVHLAQEMSCLKQQTRTETEGLLDWLSRYTGLPVEDWRLRTVVQAYWQRGWDELERALCQNRKAIMQASARDVQRREPREHIEREFEKSMAKLNPLLERTEKTDRLIDLIVYRLYGLTEEEVAIVEGGV